MRWTSPPPRRGFSLVELLVVMAFIAILAAIAIPHFTRVTNRAHDAEVKSDIRNAYSSEEEQYIHEGAYVAFVVEGPERVSPPGFRPSTGVTVTATLVDGGGVRIVGSHPGASNPWCLSNATGEVVPGDSC